MKKFLFLAAASILLSSCAMMLGDKMAYEQLFAEKIYTYPNLSKDEIMRELKTQHWHQNTSDPSFTYVDKGNERLAIHFTKRVKGKRFKWNVKALVVFDVFDGKMRVRMFPPRYKHKRDRTYRKVKINPALNNFRNAVFSYSDKLDKMIRHTKKEWPSY